MMMMRQRWRDGVGAGMWLGVVVWCALIRKFQKCSGSRLLACLGTCDTGVRVKSLIITDSTGIGMPKLSCSHLKATIKLGATVGPFLASCCRNAPSCVAEGRYLSACTGLSLNQRRHPLRIFPRWGVDKRFGLDANNAR